MTPALDRNPFVVRAALDDPVIHHNNHIRMFCTGGSDGRNA